MKDFRAAIILFLPLLVFISCSKDSQTIVHGRVVDKVTGKGLDSVGLYLLIHFKKDGIEKSRPASVRTDSAGYFSYQNDDYFTIYSVSRLGYLKKGPGRTFVEINAGTINDVTIQMIPLDGTILLRTENVTGVFDSLQVVAYSPNLKAETDFSNGLFYFLPLTALPMDTTYEEYFRVPTGENLTLYWSHSFIQANSVTTKSPYMATVAVSRNDTTVFSIEY